MSILGCGYFARCNFRISWRASWEACSQILPDYSYSPSPKSVLSCYIKLSRTCTSLHLTPPCQLATIWLHCEHTLILFVTMCLPPQHVDYENSTVCGYLKIQGLTEVRKSLELSQVVGFNSKIIHNIIHCRIPSRVSWEGAMIPSHRNLKTSIFWSAVV